VSVRSYAVGVGVQSAPAPAASCRDLSPRGEVCGVWRFVQQSELTNQTSPLGERSRRFAAGEGASLFPCRMRDS
jgi:hypothetical protein